MVNLFDVWMIFAVALLLALVSAGVLRTQTSRTDVAAAEAADSVPGQGNKIDKIQLTREQLAGEGERLGVAYRLKSGEIVYVPERKADH